MNYPQYISGLLLDTVFPAKCVECGQFPAGLKREYLCKSCLRKIPINQTSECIGCKTKTSSGRTCINCRETNRLDRLLVVSDYKDSLVVKITKLLKYRFVKEAVVPISFAIKKYIYILSKDKNFNILEEGPVITFVPMRQRRINWRGFNQAELIAEATADILQQPLVTDILTKTRDSKPQAEIKERNERLEKIKNSFKIIRRDAIQNRTVLIIDDICTTGGTLNECAKVLKEAGAKKVIGFVFARG